MDDETEATLDAFVRHSAFRARGAVITDLDGTAVFEREGRVLIAPEVEFGLKHLSDRGRPVAINTLRFPLNVVRTFGSSWSAITDAPLPLVSLNGAITGHITDASGRVEFQELDALVLAEDELARAVDGVRGLVEAGIGPLLVFHYPRDWRKGELIWTPDEETAAHARDKYRSASEVFWGPPEALRERLFAQDICMLFLLVEAPQDRLMAYQHPFPANFLTHRGTDKLDGARRLAARLGFDLAASVGAGDTPMDSFLSGCGLAVHVGPRTLEHAGIAATVRVPDADALGGVLRRLALLQDRLGQDGLGQDGLGRDGRA